MQTAHCRRQCLTGNSNSFVECSNLKAILNLEQLYPISTQMQLHNARCGLLSSMFDWHSLPLSCSSKLMNVAFTYINYMPFSRHRHAASPQRQIKHSQSSSLNYMHRVLTATLCDDHTSNKIHQHVKNRYHSMLAKKFTWSLSKDQFSEHICSILIIVTKCH